MRRAFASSRPGLRPVLRAVQAKPSAASAPAGRKGEPATDPDQRLQRARLLGHRPQQFLARKESPAALVQRKVYNDDNANTYRTETFATNRERPKRVNGTVDWTSTAGRGGAPPAIARYNPTTGLWDTMLGYDGGHVLGLEAGGADEDYNVVPMLPKFNRDTWREVERTLIGTGVFGYSGNNFRLQIDLAYAGNTAKIPDSLTLSGYADVPKFTGKGKSKKKAGTEYGKKVLDITKSQPGDIVTTPAPTDDEIDTFQGTKPTTKQVGQEIAKRKDYKKDKFLQYVATKKHLPTSKKQDYPDKPSQRPYEYLDVLSLAGQVFTDANFAPRKEFTSMQRALILKYNMAENGGQLRSDDPADPHQILDERGAANFPEVDHIIPKSQGGSNFFSNARLVSWQLNNEEDRVKDITPYIALDRINYPALTGKEDPEAFEAKGKMIVKKWLGEDDIATFKRSDAVGALQWKTFLPLKTAGKLLDIVLPALVHDGFLTYKKGVYTVA